MPSQSSVEGFNYITGGVRMEQKELGNMDIWKTNIETRLNDMQHKQNENVSKLNGALKDIADLKTSEKLQDIEINNIKSTLSEIKEDTSWIRRKITGALITAGITAVVGGIVGIAIANIFG